MAKIKSIGLKCKTLAITTEFFENIKKLDKNDPSTYQFKLYSLVEKFFKDMNRFGKTELASLLAKHQFDHVDYDQQEKYTDAFNCLVAFIVDKYNESDLLRYFLPKEHGIENKPQLTPDSWRIAYWAKFLTYWLGSKLFNRQKFIMQEGKVGLAQSIATIKKELHEHDYFDLKNQNTSFNENLNNIVQGLVEKRNPVNKPTRSSFLAPNAAVPAPAAASAAVPPVAPVPPAPPPPAPLPNLPEKNPQDKVNPDEKKNDRNDLLAAIRQGIKLRPTNDKQKSPIEVSNGNLGNILRNTLANIKRAKQGDTDDEDNASRNSGTWPDETTAGGMNNETYTDGPYDEDKTSQFFVELDEGQRMELMEILERKIPQVDLEADLDTYATTIISAIDSMNQEATASKNKHANPNLLFTTENKKTVTDSQHKTNNFSKG